VRLVEITKKNHLWRKVFFFLAAFFTLTVTIQVFLAGFATFIDPAKWHTHVAFVKVIEFLPIIMLLISFMGKLPKIVRWQCVGLFALIILMYATSNIPNAGAFHPVVALFMFWLSTVIGKKAWQSAFKVVEQ
jgi:putative tricarboxylic transport membrane protein